MDSTFLSIDEIAKATHGKIINRSQLEVLGVSTDSRSIQENDMFIPLIGEQFDGHQYLDEAVKKGASCIITSQPFSTNQTSVILVSDTLKALQDLAVYYRSKLKCKIIGITGSNGKTTSKFFAESLLSLKWNVFASQKSFNNHIGVPLTILQLRKEHDVGIIEIGMNRPGEISELTRIAKPHVSVVTTVGRAHLMEFGSVDGICKEKGDIYRYSKEATHIFNLDNPWTLKLKDELWKKGDVCFSQNRKEADIHIVLEKMTLNSLSIVAYVDNKKAQIEVPVYGKHNIVNLMVAASLGRVLGLEAQEIFEGLKRCSTVWGRNMLIDLPQNAKMIFDGYNANPDSMKALLENLSVTQVQGKKIAILGDMLELGNLSESLHRELGSHAARSGIDVLIFVGQFCEEFESGVKDAGFEKKLIISRSYEDVLAKNIVSMVQPSDIVVLKGSRGAKLEKFVPHFNPINWQEKN